MCAGEPTAWWISPRSEPNTANVTATPSTLANLCYVAAECSKSARGLRHGTAAARLAGIAGSNSAGGMDVCLLWELCGVRRDLHVGLITRPEEAYRWWCVFERDREASIMRRSWPTMGCCTVEKRKKLTLQRRVLGYLAINFSEKDVQRTIITRVKNKNFNAI